jgi:hypothetical protein
MVIILYILLDGITLYCRISCNLWKFITTKKITHLKPRIKEI